MKKSKSTYVDGFVLVVPKKNLALYKKMAQEGARMWMGYGAIDYKECVADDMKAPWAMNFAQLAKAKKNEVVIFSYITYKSKADRNRINKQIMSDMQKEEKKYNKKMTMPFDMKRMTYGGFKILVDERGK